jgi:hypothetical protein
MDMCPTVNRFALIEEVHECKGKNNVGSIASVQQVAFEPLTDAKKAFKSKDKEL